MIVAMSSQDQDQGKTRQAKPGPSAAHSILAGWISGISALSFVHPIDTIRTRLQANPAQFHHSFRYCIRQTIAQEGFRGLYKGFFPPLCSQGIYKAVIFTTSNAVERVLRESCDSQNAFFNALIGGAIAGTVNSMIVTPVELIRNRLQTQYQSPASGMPVQTVRSILSQVRHQEGWQRLWKGLTPTIYRDGLGVAFFFGSYHLSTNFLKDETSLSPSSIVLCSGAWGGICFWVIALPFDTMKTLIQIDEVPNRGMAYYTSLLYRENGIKGLYRGWQAAFTRGIPSAGITLSVYHSALGYLQSLE